MPHGDVLQAVAEIEDKLHYLGFSAQELKTFHLVRAGDILFKLWPDVDKSGFEPLARKVAEECYLQGLRDAEPLRELVEAYRRLVEVPFSPGATSSLGDRTEDQ